MTPAERATPLGFARRVAIVAIAALLLTTPLWTPSPAAAHDAVYYVSLGDSAAAGVQPRGADARGYADQLLRRMRAHLPRLGLVKLGCPGETTASLTTGTDSHCAYSSGAQLSEATSFLRAHAGRVAFITVSIGANDILDACFDVDTGALAAACVRELMPQVEANLAAIIATLRDVAPGVPIAGMSYWDPFLGSWISGPDGETLARTNHEAMQTLNAGLVATYQDEGALVAHVAGSHYFDTDDFSHLVETRWGLIPENVANACTWTWFCARPPLGPDPHPNTRGYAVIADAFAAVLSD